MKILDAKVHDYPALGWANPAHLQILVDHAPTYEETKNFIYKTRTSDDMIDLGADQERIVNSGIINPKPLKALREGTAYFSENGGYVHFFYHNPSNETGFGGSVFRGKLEDGSEFAVKGPWSSNPGAMKELFGIDTMDVSMTDDPKAWERGYTYFAGHITVELAKQAIPFILPEFSISLEEPYLIRLVPFVPIYPEGSPNWHRREYERKKALGVT